MSTDLYDCRVVKRPIKRHWCVLCNKEIAKGQEHLRIFSICIGDVACWRVHKECQAFLVFEDETYAFHGWLCWRVHKECQAFLDNLCAKCELRNSGWECNHIACFEEAKQEAKQKQK